MSPARKCIPAAFLLAVAAGAIASDAPASGDERRLIGAWQEGMTPRLAQAMPEQRNMAKKAGLLGSVIVYKADHRFAIYPACGPKQADLRKAGLQSVQGTWQLADSGELISTVSIAGRELKTQARVQWQDGQMISLDTQGRVVLKAGKYEGPVPPEC